MRVCYEKLTGKLIEAQSGGDYLDFGPQSTSTNDQMEAETVAYRQSNLETLRANAISHGWSANDIVVEFATPEEWSVFINQIKSENAEINKAAREAATKIEEDKFNAAVDARVAAFLAKK
jgi:hypothetical protein